MSMSCPIQGAMIAMHLTKKTTRLSEGTTITTQAFGPLTYWSLKWKQLMLILHLPLLGRMF